MVSRLSNKIIPVLILITCWLWIAGAGSTFGALTFSLFESGTTNTSLSVGPGGGFAIDVAAQNITAEVFTQANLDAFTYRIIFPNEDFTLTGNLFANPFDNAQSPAGFNGSVPWYTGADIPITNLADAGSPGTTPFSADLYRTTATLTGTPVSGKFVVLETLNLLAPAILGDYIASMNIIEAVDFFGEFHSAEFESPLTVSVVPIPSAFGLLLPGLAAVIYIRRRLTTMRS